MPLSHLLKIQFNIIIPWTPSLPSGLFPLGFQIKNPVCASHVSHTCHMPCPSHSFCLDKPKNIWWRIQITKLIVMQSSPLPFYLTLLRSNYHPEHPILKHPQPTFLPHCERHSFTPMYFLTNLLTRNYKSLSVFLYSIYLGYRREGYNC